jgi:uncharacterized protein (TIGR02452 family)
MFDERQATNPAAREILKILDTGGYTSPSGAWVSLRDSQDSAERGTRLYTPEDLDVLRTLSGAGHGMPHVEVVDATTQVAALSLAAESPVALLNFASARNPGGGFLGGARAQEEELCRCSGLYRTLITQPAYYTTNREQQSLLYTDNLIYSPGVPFIRVAADAPSLEAPFLASVITTPAPNAGAVRKNNPSEANRIEETFERRWMNVLAVAKDRGHRVIVLGAWGCGAFRNDPAVAARTAAKAIAAPGFAGAFDRLVFAIPGKGEQSSRNLAVFREHLAR